MVTNVYSGVSKMFLVYERDQFSVAAVTAGMAILSGLTIAEHAKRFCAEKSKQRKGFQTVQAVAEEFLKYIRGKWEADVDFANTDPKLHQFLPSLQFIVAGHCSGDNIGRVYKLDVSNNRCIDTFPTGDHCGACWAGQADFVERLLLGVDHGVKFAVQEQFGEKIKQATTQVLAAMVESLTKNGVEVPEGFEMDFAGLPSAPSWDSAQASIHFQDLSTQYAIDFVELLVNTQSGMQRFGSGIPTVGGRTHIGVLRRGEAFKMLNEPELTHNHTGYAHDL